MIRDFKGRHSGRRKMMPDKNMDTNKGMKNTKNGNDMGKYIYIYIYTHICIYNFSFIYIL